MKKGQEGQFEGADSRSRGWILGLSGLLRVQEGQREDRVNVRERTVLGGWRSVLA